MRAEAAKQAARWAREQQEAVQQAAVQQAEALAQQAAARQAVTAAQEAAAQGVAANSNNKCMGPDYQKPKGCVPSTGPTQATIRAGCGCNNGYTNCECNSGRCNDGSIKCNRANPEFCKDCSGRDGEYGCPCTQPEYPSSQQGICNNGLVCSDRDIPYIHGTCVPS